MKKYIIVLACMTCVVSSYAQEKAGVSSAQPLTLEECINLARSNNKTLRDAALEIKASNEQVGEMRAKYLPEISASVMAFQAFDKIIKADGTYPEELAALAEINPAFADMAGQPYSFHELNCGYTAMVSVMQPLYAGGQITGANRMAKVGKEISELQYSLKEMDVVQKVTENYWQIAQLKYNLQTIEAAEKQMEAVYKKVNDFVETGVTTRNALLQVRLRRQELASQRIQLESASRVLTMLLAQQIGLGCTKPEHLQLVFPEQQADVALPQYVDSYTAALTRVESQLAHKSVEANELQIKLERGKLLPTIAVGVMGHNTGMGGLSNGVKDNMHTNMTNALALGTVSVPISAWFGGTHAVRKAKIRHEQSVNDCQNTIEQLAIDNETAWTNLEEAYRQIGIARTSVEEAEENLRMATDMYATGQQTVSDLLDAETLNRQARSQLSNAIATYYIKLADYKRKVE